MFIPGCGNVLMLVLVFEYDDEDENENEDEDDYKSERSRVLRTIEQIYTRHRRVGELQRA